VRVRVQRGKKRAGRGAARPQRHDSEVQPDREKTVQSRLPVRVRARSAHQMRTATKPIHVSMRESSSWGARSGAPGGRGILPTPAAATAVQCPEQLERAKCNLKLKSADCTQLKACALLVTVVPARGSRVRWSTRSDTTPADVRRCRYWHERSSAGQRSTGRHENTTPGALALAPPAAPTETSHS
jgi:hypothetical protein